VDENVGSAVIRLNEAEALGCVEPLYGTSAHDDILFESLIEDCRAYRSTSGDENRFWRKFARNDASAVSKFI